MGWSPFGWLISSLVAEGAGAPRDRALQLGLIGGLASHPALGAALVMLIVQQEQPVFRSEPAERPSLSPTAPALLPPTDLGIVMPELRRKPLAKALNLLTQKLDEKNARADVSIRINPADPRSRVDKNKVIDQSPRAGEPLFKNIQIIIDVCVAPEEKRL